MKKVAENILKLTTNLNRWFTRAGSVVLFATMLIAVANMGLRPLGLPVTGSFELMGLGCSITAALGLAMAQEKKSHISVDILFNRMPRPLRIVLHSAGAAICAVLFTAAAWRLFRMGFTQLETGEVSETLRIPFYPVIWIVAAGFLLLSIRLAAETLSALSGQER